MEELDNIPQIDLKIKLVEIKETTRKLIGSYGFVQEESAFGYVDGTWRRLAKELNYKEYEEERQYTRQKERKRVRSRYHRK